MVPLSVPQNEVNSIFPVALCLSRALTYIYLQHLFNMENVSRHPKPSHRESWEPREWGSSVCWQVGHAFLKDFSKCGHRESFGQAEQHEINVSSQCCSVNISSLCVWKKAGFGFPLSSYLRMTSLSKQYRERSVPLKDMLKKQAYWKSGASFSSQRRALCSTHLKNMHAL